MKQLGPILIVIIAAAVAALGRPEAGLAAGILLALSGLAVAGPMTDRVSRVLIQACVVLLGLRMDLHEVVRAGASGMLFAVATIVLTFALGWALGRVLKVEGRLALLVSSGTAICGGSAIAAVGSVLGSSRTQMGVATGTVFILNAAALYLFPPLGSWLGLSPTQFGTWAGIAIHDISSVVGAGAAFDRLVHSSGLAMETATVVKLARVIWIIPICLVAAAVVRRGAMDGEGRRGLALPWFILLFVGAAAVRTWLPREVEPIAPTLLDVARRGMAVALFLIGAGLSWRALRSVGWRPLVMGLVLWVCLSVPAMLVVRATVK